MGSARYLPGSSANEFCTVTDLRFLPSLLVLRQSLADACADFRLRVFCLDGDALQVLRTLDLDGCIPIDFADVEAGDPELRAVRSARTRSEYCWTATPTLCRHALEREPELDTITYLDADLFFFEDPGIVLRELGDGSVLLFRQRMSSRDQSWSKTSAAAERLTEIYGEFNAGSITLRNDEHGRAVLSWWRERCLDWCFDRAEPGRWADQRYLTELPHLFPGVRISTHNGAALAPWNSNKFVLSHRDERLMVDDVPAVFHHFSSLKVQRGGRWRGLASWVPNIRPLRSAPDAVIARHDACYALSPAERQLVWEPYLERLDQAVAYVAALAPEYIGQLPVLRARDVISDAALTAFLAAYHLAGRRLPAPLRSVLSSVRLAIERRVGAATGPTTDIRT